jgi:high-affinity Fe2+/Pb2+ permease
MELLLAALVLLAEGLHLHNNNNNNNNNNNKINFRVLGKISSILLLLLLLLQLLAVYLQLILE